MEYLLATLIVSTIALSIFFFYDSRTPPEKLIELKEELIEIEVKEKRCKISLDKLFKSFSSAESQLVSDKYEKLYEDMNKSYTYYNTRASGIKREIDNIEKHHIL